jgi:hypothetical protein
LVISLLTVVVPCREGEGNGDAEGEGVGFVCANKLVDEKTNKKENDKSFVLNIRRIDFSSLKLI